MADPTDTNQRPTTDASGDIISTGIPDAANSGPADPDTEPKRKRGRPSNAEIAARNGGTPGGADTGRGKETRTESRKETQGGTRTKTAPLAVGDFAKQIEGIHKMGAMFLKNPLIEISKDESEKLAVALQGVMKHHSINISPVALAWIQLAGVGGIIYGPRIGLTLAAKKAAAPKVQKPEPTAPAMDLGGAVDLSGHQPGKMRFQ